MNTIYNLDTFATTTVVMRRLGQDDASRTKATDQLSYVIQHHTNNSAKHSISSKTLLLFSYSSSLSLLSVQMPHRRIQLLQTLSNEEEDRHMTLCSATRLDVPMDEGALKSIE